MNLSSSLINCLSPSTTFCLMAKSSTSDDDENNNNDEDDDDDASFHEKGLMVLNSLPKTKKAHPNLFQLPILTS